MTGWTALPDGVGTVLAVAGEIGLAAQASRLRAWRGDVPLWRAEVDEANPGRPVVLADRVLWGPYAVDLAGGSVTRLDSARVGDGYGSTAYAWAPDGSLAVVAGRRLDPGSTLPPSAVWLLREGWRVTLWSGADVPPRAVLADPPWIAVGHRQVDLYGVEGDLRRTVDGVTSPVRLDSAGGRLLVVEAGLLAVRDLRSGELLGRAGGGWTDACLTPHGEDVIGVDLAGRIRRLPVAQGLVESVDVAAEGPALAVATDGRTLLAAFAGLPGLRRRTL